ncbi:MAG: hypothetical protein AAGA81_07540 [Acidobacteriota bacterium]
MAGENSGGLTLPMQTDGTQHIVDRIYRESGPFQWVRETFINAEEAGATRVEFGIEWQAVESLGVYRRVIADNGQGMTADELVGVFNTFGGGGKPNGGAHENFGVGSKTSLMPWNRFGIVVVSWVEGEASMIWLHQDSAGGDYGLRLFDALDPTTGESSLEHVYGPFDDPDNGCDWSQVRPDWIDQHGTVIVLLGNDPGQDTVLGDPSRDEADIKGISTYLNRRVWEIDASSQVTVDELRSNDRSGWPRSGAEAVTTVAKNAPDRRTNRRAIRGARHYIEYPVDFKKGELSSSGSVPLDDGTVVDGFLWNGQRPAVQSYAAVSGYIAALYRNELYNVGSHHSTYRMFGISESKVRTKLWLVIRPPEADQTVGSFGVYPRTDRNSLLLQGGAAAGRPLPFEEWAADFADRMPDDIRSAIREARGSEAGSIEDDSWRDRLADRFGSRWRIRRIKAGSGPASVDPDAPGTMPRKAKKIVRSSSGGGATGGLSGTPAVGTRPGRLQGRSSLVAGGIPTYRAVGSGDVGAGILAAWQPNDPEHPEGVVLINQDHPVLQEVIASWQGQYADHHAEEIASDVLRVYGESAVAKIAHSEHLKSIMPSHAVEADLRSDAALTMSLLGLIGEEAIIAPRVGGKYAKRKRSGS